MDIVVRKAEVSDADKLFKLVSDFATSFKTDHAAFEECLKNLFSDESVFLFVAENKKELIGYCLGFDHYAFYANGRVSWVEEIMVNENFRCNGIGRKLMEAFEEWAKSRNSKLVALGTRRAASFYKALGYEESAIYFRKLL